MKKLSNFKSSLALFTGVVASTLLPLKTMAQGQASPEAKKLETAYNINVEDEKESAIRSVKEESNGNTKLLYVTTDSDPSYKLTPEQKKFHHVQTFVIADPNNDGDYSDGKVLSVMEHETSPIGNTEVTNLAASHQGRVGTIATFNKNGELTSSTHSPLNDQRPLEDIARMSGLGL